MHKTILKYSSLTVFCWLFFASATFGLEADVFEADNTPAQALARAALNDGAQTHTIHATNDIDYVHFSASAGHTYTLETTVLEANMDTYLYLLATNGTTVIAENDDSGVGLASFISYKLDISGTFYALIEHYSLNHGLHNGGTGTYSIALTDLGAEGAFGTIKWQKPLYNSWSSPAIGADGKIYIGSASNALLCLNQDGSTARTWQTTSPVLASPAIDADGKAYAATPLGLIYCCNPDGTTGYVWNTGSPLYSAPAIGSAGTVYIGAYNSNLYAFNSSDGTTGHIWTTEGQILSSPAIGPDGLIYLGTLQSNLYCFTPAGATARVWRTDGAISYGAPSIDTNGVIYITASSGRLYGFNSDGTTNHVWKMSAGSSGTPVIDSQGTIYINTSLSNGYAFNPDGSTSHIFSCDGSAAPLICADGSIFFCGNKFYGFNPDGTTNWSLNYAWSAPGGGPALDTNGILYVNCGGNLLAIYATGSLARSVWPKFAHDLKNTGALPPRSPTNVAATDGLYNNKVAINWTPVNYASSYDILRGTTNNTAVAQICAEAVSGTNYADTSATAGVTYYYWVLSRNNSGASALPGGSDTGWQHTFVSSAAGDYDHDQLADPAIYNQANGDWKVRLSGGNYGLAVASNLLGGAGFSAVTADYDGDGIADPAVYEEASGSWTVKQASSGYTSLTASNFFGTQGYSGLAADVDGDTKADLAIYSEGNGGWIFKLSGTGYEPNMTLPQTLGAQGLSAILADFDGDGLADPGVHNETSGTWTILLSAAGYSQAHYDGVLGSAGFKPAPADYDGDGRADPAVYNPTTGDWKVLLSKSNYFLLEVSGLLSLP